SSSGWSTGGRDRSLIVGRGTSRSWVRWLGRGRHAAGFPRPVAGEDPTKRNPSPVQAGLHGADRKIERPRDVFEREVLQLVHDEHGAEIGWDRHEGALDVGGHGGAVRMVG